MASSQVRKVLQVGALAGDAITTRSHVLDLDYLTHVHQPILDHLPMTTHPHPNQVLAAVLIQQFEAAISLEFDI
jgi:hypothetical protein